MTPIIIHFWTYGNIYTSIRDPPPLSKLNRSAFSKEAVVIEARILTAEDENGAGGEVKTNSIENKYGRVVGEVVVLTEVSVFDLPWPNGYLSALILNK